MVNKKDKCKEKTMKDKKNKGYKEPKGGYKEEKDPLTELAPRHSAAALKKDADAISNDVAVVPIGEYKEETIAQEASVKDLKVDDVEIVSDKEQIGESVTLRFDDSEKFVNAVSEFDNNLPYDFDEGSFIVSVPNEKVNAFRELMREKGIEEITFSETISDVQSKRSNRAIAIDKSIKANRVGHKENPTDLKDWAENPNTLDLLGVDAGEV